MNESTTPSPVWKSIATDPPTNVTAPNGFWIARAGGTDRNRWSIDREVVTWSGRADGAPALRFNSRTTYAQDTFSAIRAQRWTHWCPVTPPDPRRERAALPEGWRWCSDDSISSNDACTNFWIHDPGDCRPKGVRTSALGGCVPRWVFEAFVEEGLL